MNDHIDSQNSDLLPKINYDKNYKVYIYLYERLTHILLRM